jgi:hypothetical protein
MPRINWGQAAGEALLIFAGVLLALGADALWEERSERAREKEYLGALVGELDQLRIHVSGVAEVATEIEDSGRELLRVSAKWSSAPVSADSLADLIANLSGEGEWSPPSTVYDDLVNTGAVGLIQSDDIRRELNELMASMDWVGTRQERHNGFFWTEMEPYFRANLPVLAVFGWRSLPATAESWTPGPFVGTEEFRNLVAAKSLTAMDVRYAAEDLLVLIERVVRTVDAHGGAL